ncbi:winged helix-turn-helix domain-containing protein [Occallatibacter savannae]|uniref:winged helix-turn-helix domain-containing protein n=1 Tax=Occallatibacter savannae TaxID=1002691 RepID=UPI000D68EDB9|nr:winged helix-turn-helix domain-containing protein [Occallatibacter savannae]
MDRPATTKRRVGEWYVDPDAGTMTRNGETTRLDLRSMRLLTCLVEHGGQVVTIDELISHVWAGVSVSPDSVYQAITALRRQLGDDPRKPAYIETVPRLGYRLIAQTTPWAGAEAGDAADPAAESPAGSKPVAIARRRGTRRIAWAALILVVVLALAFVVHAKLSGGTRSAASIVKPATTLGVLPFLDLTEGMHNEEFADGMTEEIIDKLSKVSGLQVPSATASFYYKSKNLPVTDIARGLKVSYLLDGSVRKSNGRVRIAARLVRADNSYVIWTNSYDRPVSDLILVQDDIAGEVAKALEATVVQQN